MPRPRLIYPAAISLDGYLAGPDGDMSWLLPHAGPNPESEELMHRAGSLLVGRTTHDGDDPNADTESEGAFGGQWHGTQIVLTHRLPEQPVAGCEFFDDLDRALERARECAGDKDVEILGADVARQCLERGLVDEVVMMIVPVLLGDGTRIFHEPGGHEVRLRPTRVTQAGTTTNLWFDVLR